MNAPQEVPDRAALRRAIGWLVERRDWTPARIDEASLLFDLSPVDEEFLLQAARRLPKTEGAAGPASPGAPPPRR